MPWAEERWTEVSEPGDMGMIFHHKRPTGNSQPLTWFDYAVFALLFMLALHTVSIIVAVARL